MHTNVCTQSCTWREAIHRSCSLSFTLTLSFSLSLFHATHTHTHTHTHTRSTRPNSDSSKKDEGPQITHMTYEEAQKKSREGRNKAAAAVEMNAPTSSSADGRTSVTV